VVHHPPRSRRRRRWLSRHPSGAPLYVCGDAEPQGVGARRGRAPGHWEPGLLLLLLLLVLLLLMLPPLLLPPLRLLLLRVVVLLVVAVLLLLLLLLSLLLRLVVGAVCFWLCPASVGLPASGRSLHRSAGQPAGV